ncbi:mechanosensitive ion channel domain-containing protein [Lysobacter sp. F6437]|uniref:mechanosensitive ion channel domain-containing protein n=1 Tax=Lysobacter sp. F6437 TaxID=3459296 RepID=UPI00403DBC2A
MRMRVKAPTEQVEDAGLRVAESVDAATRQGWQGLQPLLEYRLLNFASFQLTVGGVVAAVLAVLIALLASMLLRRALVRYGKRRQNVNHAAIYAVSRVAHYLLLLIGVMVALRLAGVPIGEFAVFAGALGIGLGFGLREIFANFIGGLVLLFDQSLKVGDFIEIDADVRGTVRDINIRATRITTNDNIDIMVPNAEFMTGRVVNWTHRDVLRRMRVPFKVAYGVDKERVKKAALEAAAKVPFTLSMEGRYRPQVWLADFGDGAVEYLLAVWLTEEATKRNAAIKAAYLWELDTAFKHHGIEIPLPQRDLHLRSVFGLVGDDAIALLRGVAPPATAGADAVPELSEHERAELAGNDAREDAERPVQSEGDAESTESPAAPKHPRGH